VSLIIHAPNVHQGGGKALLLPLLTAARNQVAVKALLDGRLTLPDGLVNGITNIRVKRSFFGRLAGEWKLRALAGEGDTVICFGNLPPPFQAESKGHCILAKSIFNGQSQFKGPASCNQNPAPS